MHDLDSIQDVVFVNTVGRGGDESIVNTGWGIGNIFDNLKSRCQVDHQIIMHDWMMTI